MRQKKIPFLNFRNRRGEENGWEEKRLSTYRPDTIDSKIKGGLAISGRPISVN